MSCTQSYPLPSYLGEARVCNSSMTISLMQTRESWGRPGSAIPLWLSLSHADKVNSILLCTTHTLWLSLYLLGIHLKSLTKTVSGDQIKFCCIILSFLYKRSSAWSRLKLITKMGFKHHHPHTKNFFNPSKKRSGSINFPRPQDWGIIRHLRVFLTPSLTSHFFLLNKYGYKIIYYVLSRRAFKMNNSTQ